MTRKMPGHNSSDSLTTLHSTIGQYSKLIQIIEISKTLAQPITRLPSSHPCGTGSRTPTARPNSFPYQMQMTVADANIGNCMVPMRYGGGEWHLCAFTQKSFNAKQQWKILYEPFSQGSVSRFSHSLIHRSRIPTRTTRPPSGPVPHPFTRSPFPMANTQCCGTDCVSAISNGHRCLKHAPSGSKCCFPFIQFKSFIPVVVSSYGMSDD